MNSIVRLLILSLGISTALVVYNHLSEVALNFRFVLVGVVLAQWLIQKKESDDFNPSQWDWKPLWQKLRSFVNPSESVSPNTIDAATQQSEPVQPQSTQKAVEPGTEIAAWAEGLSTTDWRKFCNQLGLSGSKIPTKNRAEFLLKADVTTEKLQQARCLTAQNGHG